MINYSLNPTQVTPSLYATGEEACRYVANQIADLIRQRQGEGEQAVLGLATGNTPIDVYHELIRLHKNEGLSFTNVVSFNLDEYYPIHPQDKQSYSYFMHHYLFGHIDIDQRNVNIPHSDCSSDGILEYCQSYEERIINAGGLDFQLLGIGRNGHIGFNEPGSSFYDTTRLVDLHPLTRKDAEKDFGDINKVPRQAISIGIHTIIQARKIVMLALGKRKSEIIREAIYGEVTTRVPASILQTLPNVEYVLDREAFSLKL